MSSFSYELYKVSDLEASLIDKKVAENRAEFAKGFKRALKVGSLTLLLANICKASSVHAVEQVSETVEIQSPANPPSVSNLHKTIVATEMLTKKKNRNLSIEAIIGFIVAVVIMLVVADTVKTNKSFNAEQAKLDYLQEGVVKMSDLIDRQHKAFLKYGI